VILLDTHALVWWVSDPSRLPAKARRAVDAAVANKDAIAVSSISIWEVAMLVAAKRLEFSIDAATWISNVEALPFLQFIPVDNRIAADAVGLTDFPHKDPADRMIVATALSLNATLVTADKRLRAYDPVTSVWD
jgi:PIN domain nuclease of toxin-antitoxin system